MGTAGVFKRTADRLEGTFLVVMGDASTDAARLKRMDGIRPGR